jgi:hypothetical protein
MFTHTHTHTNTHTHTHTYTLMQHIYTPEWPQDEKPVDDQAKTQKPWRRRRRLLNTVF